MPITNNNLDMAIEAAGLLLSLGAVQFSPTMPFTYASGLKGPIYCDNRQIWSDVEVRFKIIEMCLSKIGAFNIPFDLLAGLATAGIPHGAILADRLKKPFIYIRGKAKDHGKQNQIEGKYSPGQKIILVEDLVNQGKSLAEAISACEAAGLIISGALCIVDYQMEEARKLLEEKNIPLISLTNFENLVLRALELKLVDQDGQNLLCQWQKSPKSWTAK